MADPDPELPDVVCLLQDRLPLEQEAVSVCFDPERFARKTNAAQEEAIASEWRRQCRKNARLFNGSKFRYAGLRWAAGAPQLQLGLTSYREHVGTNCSGGHRLLREAGAAVHGDRQAFLADPLGVGALLLTADNRLALVRRALWTGEYPGRLDRPGGHAEPDELTRPAEPEPTEAAVLREVFDSVRRELRDELGVPLTHLSRAYLAGVLRDPAMGGRPTLEFVVRCSLPSTELERVYNEGKHAEADESLGIVFLTRDELFSERAVFRVPDLSELSVQYSGEEEPPASAASAAAAAAAAEDAATNNCEDGAVASEVPATEAGRSTPPPERELGLEPEPEPEPESEPPAKGKEQGGKRRRRNRKDRKAATKAESREPAAKLETAQEKPSSESLEDDGIQEQPGCNDTDSAAAEGSARRQKSSETDQKSEMDRKLLETGRKTAEMDQKPPEVNWKPSEADQKPSEPDRKPSAGEPPAPPTAPQRAELPPSADEEDEVVVVRHNGVVLLKSGDQVTEAPLPATSSPGRGRIETLAEVVNNPEANGPAAGGAEKTAAEEERERKAKLWEEMTPACRASLVLLKQMALKGFVFRF